jgi:predicted DNA-binding protein
MADRHSSHFLVRLPEVYRTQLMKLKKRTGKTLAAAVRDALEAYLAEHGLWPPPTKPEG